MIEVLQISSEKIVGFPMGDPHKRKLPVYLPPGYDPKRREPYPVIFVLAGWSGRSSKYLSEDSVFEVPLHEKLDQAISQKDILPVIVAFPDGTSKLGCSQYINSPAFGNYMDHIADELTFVIDSKFHTHKSADFRAIMGHSSGGFGAMAHGFLRPDRFQYVCSSAGDSFFELSILPSLTSTLCDIEKAGSVEAFISSILTHPSPASLGKKMISLMTVSLAPCYAPNLTKKPYFGDLFFDLKNGTLIEEVWEKYLNWDPIRLIDRHSETAQQLKYVQLECGAQDEYGLQFGHRRIAEKLKAYSIPHSIEEYPGTHSGHNWRFADRIKVMLQKMQLS